MHAAIYALGLPLALCKAPQTAISKAVCYKTKNEQLWERLFIFLLVATNCFYAGLPTVFCTITFYHVGKMWGKKTEKPS